MERRGWLDRPPSPVGKRPPLTRNQVELMQIDTTASEKLSGFRTLGISPRSLEGELEVILRQSKLGRVP
jgi:hypothetical protein